MIHRPTDSRLLANLLWHEKEYTKQLSAVLEHSQASLSSFSAYASSSPPPTSQVILTIAGSIAGADEALHKYVVSVDEWREQLKQLKDLEEEVGNIMRDREILVTRLIKASKQQKPTRDSFISPPGSPMSRAEGSSKLTSAQSELQACETHLANKERELDVRRLGAIRVGLHARCSAMIECGWTWGEMGKEGIRALEQLDAPHGHVTSQPNSPPFKSAVPDTQQSLSEISSISPSQSASQIALVSPSGHAELPNNAPSSSGHADRPYSLQIAPAHSISELVLPSQHVEDSPVADDSSSIEEDPGPLEVHENERFTVDRPFVNEPRNKKDKGKAKSLNTNGRAYPYPKPRLPNGPPAKEKDKERKTSMFGSFAGLFHKSGTTKGRWQTRVDQHIGEESNSDDGISAPPVTSINTAAGDLHRPYISLGHSRLKKQNKAKPSTVDSTTIDWSRGAPTGALPLSHRELESNSERDKGKVTKNTPDAVHSDVKTKKLTNPRANLIRRASSSSPQLPLSAGGPSLSRDSSLSKKSEMSSMSAPPASNLVFRPGSAATARAPRGRATSATVSQQQGARINHKRASSLESSPVNPTPAQPNLMSIVEEAVRQNRESRILLNPNHRLEFVTAPPSASVMLTREAEFNQSLIKPPPPLLRSPPPPKKPVAPSAAHDKLEVTVQKRPSLVHQHKHPATATPTSALAAPVPHQAKLLHADAAFAVNKSQPPKLPLKSALRTSRTPSPNTITLNRSPAVGPITMNGSSLPPPAASKQDEDAESVSSYETVHETFEPQSDDTIPPPPPPHDDHYTANGIIGSDTSHSASSAEMAFAVRRKSVRMFLPPTFSTTPPAIEDWEGDKNRRPRASRVPQSETRGWTSRNGDSGERDIWADSSDEDEEYSRARRMLSNIAGRGKR